MSVQDILDPIRRRGYVRIPIELVATYVLVIIGLSIAIQVWLYSWPLESGFRYDQVLPFVEISASVAWGPAIVLVGAVEASRWWLA